LMAWLHQSRGLRPHFMEGLTGGLRMRSPGTRQDFLG